MDSVQMMGDNDTQAKERSKSFKEEFLRLCRNHKVRVWGLMIILNIGGIIFHAKATSAFRSNASNTQKAVYGGLELFCMLALNALVIYCLSRMPTNDQPGSPKGSFWMRNRCACCGCCHCCCFYNVLVWLLVLFLNVAIVVCDYKSENKYRNGFHSESNLYSGLEIVVVFILNALTIIPLYTGPNARPTLEEVALNAI